MEFQTYFSAEDEGMLSPFKDDKLKDGGITLFQASLVLVVKATQKRLQRRMQQPLFINPVYIQ